MMTAIVIVLLLVVNLIVTKMDLKIDLSSQKMYTLTEPTVELVKNIKDDVTIYYLVESGNEKSVLQKIASKYDSLSDHITLEYKDPVLYPKFASKYVSDEIKQNSFLVVNYLSHDT
jgi:ABC-2 type transport system permease protein